MKLLCLADVHLGLVPARLPADLADRAHDLGPAAAWRRAVDLALGEGVSAVLLAGDLVDGVSDFFEAFSALRVGVSRLAEAGVQVLAVAGNHDTEVLGRLVKAVPQVRLLGAGGRWEAVDVMGPDGGACVRVVGWSFAGRWVEECPLEGSGLAHALAQADAAWDSSAPPPASRPVVTLGLLHADRDQTGSRYAPVTSAQLATAAVDVWLLGHVHKPDVSLTDCAWGKGGYLGSLTASDPGEHGARGAWLLEVEPGGELRMRHVSLAPLRWEHLSIDVSHLGQAEEVTPLLASHLERLVVSLDGVGSNPAGAPGAGAARPGSAPVRGLRPAALGCRITLVGHSPIRSQIEAVLRAEGVTGVTTLLDEVEVFIERVSVDALPAADLHELAGSSDPLGLLAARVLALKDAGSELRSRLVEQARPKIEAVGGQQWASGAAAAPLTDDEVAGILEEAALRALDALLQQRPPDARGSVGR